MDGGCKKGHPPVPRINTCRDNMVNQTHCAWCGLVADPRNPEAVVVRSERAPHASVCAHCICSAIVALYKSKRDLIPGFDEMRRELWDAFIVTRAREDELRKEVMSQLRDEYQKQFLELRDRTEPSPNEAEKTTITVPVTRYMYDRVVALAREANVPVSSWMRQAILWAFHATSHKRT